MVASGDEGEDKSEWPPELAALEQQFTAKYQRQLAQLIEKHALEIAGIHADYEAKFTSLVKEYSVGYIFYSENYILLVLYFFIFKKMIIYLTMNLSSLLSCY